MLYRSSIAAIVLAAALGATCADAQVVDNAKYPDLSGQWIRGYPGGARFDPAKPVGPRQEAPLTPEYQAIYQADLAEQAAGGQGIDPTYRCLSPGMPRIMHVYSPMEIVVTPKTTHILIEHIHDSRRIYTDGRDWPADMYQDPQFAGFSIGQWVDEDGDGRYDALVVETRGLKGSPDLRRHRHSVSCGRQDGDPGKDLSRQSRREHPLRRHHGDRQCADAAVERPENLPSRRGQGTDLVARGNLR